MLCGSRLVFKLVARMNAFSVMSRCSKSSVKDALFFLIGPVRLAPKNRFL